MQESVQSARRFLKSLGPVEQAQVVASTAVVVMMMTILGTLIATGQGFRFVDFFSILTVGVIGYTSVYFSLRHTRQLDAQRRQLVALNTIAEAVNRIAEIRKVLDTSLEKAIELLGCNLGWIYILETDRLVLKASRGTRSDFLALQGENLPTRWIHQPRVGREWRASHNGQIPAELKKAGVQFWASIPLAAKETVAGVMIVAGNDYEMLSSGEAELMESFGNQISVALNNARLFELLRQSEQQYHDLFENAPDTYLTVARNHVVIDCNLNGSRMFGVRKEEIIGKRFEDLFSGEQCTAVRQSLDEMFESGKGIRDLEEEIRRADGEKLNITLNVSLAFDEKDRPANARVLARDITHRKKMEEAILHAQKIDSIGKLAGGVAHDFNNILASVLGAASIMRRKLEEDSHLYKYVKIIEVASRRGSSLTRQLLTFARKTETQEETVDINTLIRETLTMFERSVPKNIVIRTGLTDALSTVRGDPGQIQQALLNLFLNARDAMPEGGELTVTSDLVVADAHTTSQFASVKPGQFVRTRVTDSGIGMEKSVQSRVFEPFFTTKNTGTGLGLSVLYGVVQNHGGFVDVESEPGRGTTFSVYLPSSGEALHEVLRERRQRIPRGSEHILVIDDEVSVCEIARDLLTDLGYMVTHAHDGKAGIELYRGRQASIDLVLLDLNMPLMGGKETFEKLRSINRNLHIIILTGYGENVIHQDNFPGNADSFLQKPFQLEDLAFKIREVLDSRTSTAELVH